MDISAIPQAIEALKQASEIVKALRSADAAYEKVELKLKIAELAEAVVTARLALVEAQEEIQALKDQIARQSAEGRANVVTKNGVYYVPDGEKRSGPFCPRCWDVDGRQIRLTELSGPLKVMGKFKCPQCEQIY